MRLSCAANREGQLEMAVVVVVDCHEEQIHQIIYSCDAAEASKHPKNKPNNGAFRPRRRFFFLFFSHSAMRQNPVQL